MSEPMWSVEGIHRGMVEESNVVSHGQGKKGIQEGERAVAMMGDNLYKEELIREGHILRVMETPFLTIIELKYGKRKR